MKQKLSKLEALRGFAAIYVVLHHTVFSKESPPIIFLGQNVSILFRFGQEAVILFFFLSGFVINYSFLKSKDQSFKTFFLKRFLRIYIPLILVFIFNYALFCLSKTKFEQINWHTLVGNLMMMQDDFVSLKPNIVCRPFLNNLPLWSLSYEWWFYMIFILLMKQSNKNASLKVYAIGIIAAITYLFYPNFINRELMYLIIWWTGVDMAKLYLVGKKISISNLKFPIISIALNAFILFINTRIHKSTLSIGYSPFLELRHFGFAFLAIFLAIYWHKIKWFGFKYTIGLFELIAPISFGIYISHWFIIKNNFLFEGIIQNRFLVFGTNFLVCILFSYVAERIVYVHLNKYILSRLVKKKQAI